MTTDTVKLTQNESVDPSRKLFSVEWTPTAQSCVASGDEGGALIKATMNRGALACAAQALGLAHRMMDMSVQYTYAIANKLSTACLNTSHAKLAACEAADLAAKNCMQVHGAMGYTWEVDLHIFMKKAWAFNNTWGDNAFHKMRVAEFIFADDAPIGAGNTFIAQ